MVGSRRRLAAPLLRLLLGVAVASQVLFAQVGLAAGATNHRLVLSTATDFVAQTNFVQCVGASMQMMMNVMAPRDDRTGSTQLELQKLARFWSGSRPDGSERQGASVRGWAAGLNTLGVGPYKLVGEDTLDAALRTAATAISETGKPVGLLVWRGRHA
jgi:hypothetical protein